MVSKIGEIRVSNKTGGLTLATMSSIRGFKDHGRISYEKLSVTPLVGAFPRVVMEQPLVTACDYNVSEVNGKNQLTLTDAVLFQNAKFYGNCIAINKGGPLAIVPDVNDLVSCRGMKVLRAAIQTGKKKAFFWLAIPSTLLGKNRADTVILVSENSTEKKRCHIILHQTSHVSFAAIRDVKLISPEKEARTYAERAMMEMGVALAPRAEGKRPRGLVILSEAAQFDI